MCFMKNKKIITIKNKVNYLLEQRKSVKTRILLAVIACVMVFVAVFIAITVVNLIANFSFRETFYNINSIKVGDTIRVIQLSDLHNSKYGKDNSKLLERVTELEPDIIIATGDMLDRRDKKQDVAYNLLEKLTKVAPTYFVYGNNEWALDYDFDSSLEDLEKEYGQSENVHDLNKLLKGAKKSEIRKELEKRGVRVLQNEMTSVEVDGGIVDIYGLFTSNPSAFWHYAGKDYEKFMKEDTHHIKIFASHEPYVYETFKDNTWGDLMLCGHTHGGLSVFPVVGALWEQTHGLFPEKTGQPRYVRGRYDIVGGSLIVNRGLSNRGIVRINNKPELVIIDIGR